MKRERYRFTKQEVKEIMNRYKADTPEKALENYAYYMFDLRHNCSIILGRIGKTFFDIEEVA